jgi:hypothetical protein
VIHQPDAVQMIAQRNPAKKNTPLKTLFVLVLSRPLPIGLHIVRPPKQLNLSRARTQLLNDPKNFVRLVAGRTHLGHNHVTVQTPVQLSRIAFQPDQTVLLAVVQLIAGATRPNDALQLIGLDPNQLVHPFVAPQLEAFAAQLHGASLHPQENQSVVFTSTFTTVSMVTTTDAAVSSLSTFMARSLSLRALLAT